mmetsp:Transcript_19089/g.53566  ORF Transcript_19089/g.53566 Transcript_19089/m.53566 type:complete len:219 (-) Transcript_19089:170-826(-)
MYARHCCRPHSDDRQVYVITFWPSTKGRSASCSGRIFRLRCHRGARTGRPGATRGPRSSSSSPEAPSTSCAAFSPCSRGPPSPSSFAGFSASGATSRAGYRLNHQGQERFQPSLFLALSSSAALTEAASDRVLTPTSPKASRLSTMGASSWYLMIASVTLQTSRASWKISWLKPLRLTRCSSKRCRASATSMPSSRESPANESSMPCKACMPDDCTSL